MSFHPTLEDQYQHLEPQDDTIFALSSGADRAAIAIIRASGPACRDIHAALCPGKPLPRARMASVRTLYDPTQPPTRATALDSRALVLYLPAPHTATGEDLLELHVHGGRAIVNAVLSAIPKCSTMMASHIRHAERGEFSRRGFYRNKMTLPEIEALGDTLAAETEQQRKLSVKGSGEELAKLYHGWRKQLIEARGELEALIDFSEDQHFDESPAQLASSVAAKVQVLREQMMQHIHNAMRGELVRNGINIALLGAPNAGKSSLLNRIVGKQVSIVTTEAGTTRDIVHSTVDVSGYLCRLDDMAGLRRSRPGADGTDVIGLAEQEGIKRAKQRALDSDVVILVFPLKVGSDGKAMLTFDPEVIETAAACAARGNRLVAVINKIDLYDGDDLHYSLQQATAILQSQIPTLDSQLVFGICCKEHVPNGHNPPSGIQPLLEGLTKVFEDMTTALSHPSSGPSDSMVLEDALSTSQRQRQLLENCVEHLDQFLAQVSTVEARLDDEVDVVVAAESLRAAAHCLARITGKGVGAGDVEEVLGVVFENFCVGK